MQNEKKRELKERGGKQRDEETKRKYQKKKEKLDFQISVNW